MGTLTPSARPKALSFEDAMLALVRAADAKRGRSLAVVERTGHRGEMTPLHVHPEDEVVYVVEGALTLFVNEESVRLVAGDAFAAPRATPHTLAVESREARYVSATVAGSATRYEDFLRAVAVPAEGSSLSWEESGDASRLAAIAAPNGIDVLDGPGAVSGARSTEAQRAAIGDRPYCS
jgi:quercetin dioxygenase-like cupin family protein